MVHRAMGPEGHMPAGEPGRGQPQMVPTCQHSQGLDQPALHTSHQGAGFPQAMLVASPAWHPQPLGWLPTASQLDTPQSPSR